MVYGYAKYALAMASFVPLLISDYGAIYCGRCDATHVCFRSTMCTMPMKMVLSEECVHIFFPLRFFSHCRMKENSCCELIKLPCSSGRKWLYFHVDYTNSMGVYLYGNVVIHEISCVYAFVCAFSVQHRYSASVRYFRQQRFCPAWMPSGSRERNSGKWI